MEAAGKPDALPEKVSLGWFVKMKRAVGVGNASVANHEPKRIDSLDDANFLKKCRLVRSEKSIPTDAIIVYDETNCFMMRPAKRVQTAQSERKKRTGRQVKRKVNARSTYTA